MRTNELSKTNSLDKWDLRFMRIAEEVATWSKDPRTKVGAVLVKDRRIIATGYNGFPRNLSDSLELYQDSDYKNKHVIHAEMNAILNATQLVKGATLYSTFSPCIACSMAVIQSQLERVVTYEPRMTRWKQDQLHSIKLMEDAGILVECI